MERLTPTKLAAAVNAAIQNDQFEQLTKARLRLDRCSSLATPGVYLDGGLREPARDPNGIGSARLIWLS